MELGKQQEDDNRNDASEHTLRSKVGMLSVVADEVVVVMITHENEK